MISLGVARGSGDTVFLFKIRLFVIKFSVVVKLLLFIYVLSLYIYMCVCVYNWLAS